VFYWIHPIYIANWQDEVVVYQEQSGNTHLFSGVSGKIIKRHIDNHGFSKQDIINHNTNLFCNTLEANSFIDSLLTVLIQKDLIFST